MSVYDNKSLNVYEREEGENVRYSALLFVNLPPSQKDSNRPTDIGKETKNLNYLVCTLKIGLSYNCSFLVRVPRQRVFKSQKKLY